MLGAQNQHGAKFVELCPRLSNQGPRRWTGRFTACLSPCLPGFIICTGRWIRCHRPASASCENRLDHSHLEGKHHKTLVRLIGIIRASTTDRAMAGAESRLPDEGAPHEGGSSEWAKEVRDPGSPSGPGDQWPGPACGAFTAAILDA